MSPAEKLQPHSSDDLLELSLDPELLVRFDKQHAQAKDRRQRDAELVGCESDQFLRYGRKHAGPVAAAGIGIDPATMRKSPECHQSTLQDLVCRGVAKLDDEPSSASIMVRVTD